MPTVKPLKEYRSLLIIDKPDGTRVAMFADTPYTIQNGRLTVFQAENGWDGSAESPHNPCPGYRLVAAHTATVKTIFDKVVPDVPWIIHCTCVPLT